MKHINMKIKIFLILSLLSGLLVAEGREPDPRTGHPKWNKPAGLMDGNLVRTVFENHAEIAHYGQSFSGEWPKGSGHLYIDGVAAFVQAEVVSDTFFYGGIPRIDTIHPLEVNYREDVDKTNTGVCLGWWPLPGYANYYQDSPAMSDDPGSWPSYWPDKPASWAGYWNGYFGKGVKNADLETYYVIDDDYDIEPTFNFAYPGTTISVPYYPDSADTSRRGIGIECAVRGFQWSHVLAEDCIFWHFAITNESTHRYENMLFGFYIDWGCGQAMPNPGGSDDVGGYDTDIDLAYAWDVDFQGQWTDPNPPGYAGFAYLESPGNPYDTVDNDNDGILNETRSSGPGIWDSTSCGYYREDGSLDETARDNDQPYWRWHWTGDEDGDWDKYTDKNLNGVWDSGEPLNDDLGADGIGPLNDGYVGPDAGEGDGMPTPGEPDFDGTDKDESDQIGLTGFRIFPVHQWQMKDDEIIWPILSELVPPTDSQISSGLNLAMYFSSGLFPLNPGETQRFSMALLFGHDYDDLVRNKKTVQSIYNANYNFSKPPDKPRLTAVPGDGKVILHWDNKAESSYDRFLQEYDFEGYRIYRSTEPSFLESRIITDAYGNPVFRKPIAQFDLKDGKTGPHLIGVQGAHFNLGDDTGLQHTFIDSNVNNGQTYYYAVVSYDYGNIARDSAGNVRFDDDGNPMGIPPTECPSTIVEEETGEIKTDVNTAVVIPNAPAGGYQPPSVIGDIINPGPGTGDITIDFILPDSVKDSTNYWIIFKDSSIHHIDTSVKFTVLRDTMLQGTPSTAETLFSNLTMDGTLGETSLFDGMVIRLKNDIDVKVIDTLTEWRRNQNDLAMSVGLDPTFTNETNPIFNLNLRYPADFNLLFADTTIDTSTALLGSYPRKFTNFSFRNLTADSVKQPFLFDDKDGDGKFSGKFIATYFGEDSTKVDTTRDTLIILIEDTTKVLGYRTGWALTLSGGPPSYNPAYSGESTLVETTYYEPAGGDTFSLHTTHPFRSSQWIYLGDTLPGDKFKFTVRKGFLSESKVKEELDRIAVVPNPYVVAAKWEPPNPYQFGRGKRKIDFIHLPPYCTIRIYTLRGNLVKKIEHSSALNDGSESWDLLSKDGMDIAYGVYIYHVTARNADGSKIGEKIGKFAVIK